ncbi:MAG: hypothetical protein Tsb002_28930 [Wenzhouxiangellaceae bacterium]
MKRFIPSTSDGHSSQWLALWLVCLVLSACAGERREPATPASDAAAATPAYRFETHRYDTSKLLPQAQVVIDNPWGDIRLRPHAEGFVRVDAGIQLIGENPPQPQFDTEESVNAFRFSVAVPGGRLQPRNNRVDLAVYLPAGLSLTLTSRDGTIEAKKTRNRILARSQSGRIVITNQGFIQAHSVDGVVQAQPMFPGWGEIRLSSEHGDAIAFIPEHNDLSIEVLKAASLHSEFTLEGALPGPLKLIRGHGADQVTISSGAAVQIYKTLFDPRVGAISPPQSGPTALASNSLPVMTER